MTIPTSTAVLAESALAGLAAISLVACGPREPTTDAERLARGRELVHQMSARLAAASAVSVTTTEVRDVVRLSGRKEQLSQTGAYSVRRPDRFYVKMTGGRGLESWYNGKTLTIASHPEKVFAQARMPETIDRTLDALAERYDMALPMADLFYSSAEKALLSDTTTGGYAGTENVADTPCVHLAFKDVGVDWELWLPTRGEPAAETTEVRPDTAHGPTHRRHDVYQLGFRPAGHRCHVRPEGAGGVRGHCRGATRCGGQEHAGRALHRASHHEVSEQVEEIPACRSGRESTSHGATEHRKTNHVGHRGGGPCHHCGSCDDVRASARRPARRRGQRR